MSKINVNLTRALSILDMYWILLFDFHYTIRL
jgi:hypothetical protein